MTESETKISTIILIVTLATVLHVKLRQRTQHANKKLQLSLVNTA